MELIKPQILCLGDSIIFGYGVSADEAWINVLANMAPEYSFINEGMCGANTAAIKQRWQYLTTQTQARQLILNGGVNDLLMGLPATKVLSNTQMIITEAAEIMDDIILLLPFKISTNPGLWAWVPAPQCFYINKQIDFLVTELTKIAQRQHIKTVDLNVIFAEEDKHHPQFLNDGIHIQPLLHKRIAVLIYEQILRLKRILNNG